MPRKLALKCNKLSMRTSYHNRRQNRIIMFVLYGCKKERNFVFRSVIFVFMSNALG